MHIGFWCGKHKEDVDVGDNINMDLKGMGWSSVDWI
jgi:hypothetical protein